MLPALSAKLLRMIQYLCDSLNYSLIYIIVIIFGAAIASGGRSLWISIISIFIFVIACDEILPDFHGESNNLKFWYTDIQLLLSLPLILMITFIALNAVGPKPVLVIDFVMRCVGFDTDLSRNQSDPLIIFMLVGTIYGAFGITIAHELCHRTDSIISQIFARWLLAFSFDTGFAIDHIYGHHRYVGNPSDPVTAQRGETIFSYLLRSIIGQAIRGLDIENMRLVRQRKKNNILTNKFYRGQLMSFAIMAIYGYYLGLINGIIMFLYAASIGKLLLEVTGYIEHYGLIRLPGQSIEARHSWDCHKRLSCYLLFNLPLHAYHHKFPSRKYYNLLSSKGCSPTLPLGYLVMIIAAFFPPIWRHLTHRKLEEWDRALASSQELRHIETNTKGALNNNRYS